MKKNILAFITATAIIFSACAQQKKTTGAKATNTAKSKTSNIEQLVMERTPCFGTCPAYRVEVNKNGHVKYISWSHTKYEGVYEKDFDAARVANLFREFDKYRVDTCQAEYQMMIADVPGVNYYFKRNGKETYISNAHFGPEFLNALSAKVDEFAQVDATWKKTAEAGQK